MLRDANVNRYIMRRSRLSSAPVEMEIDNNSDHRALLAIALNIQHNPYISTYLHILHIFTYSLQVHVYNRYSDIRYSSPQE